MTLFVNSRIKRRPFNMAFLALRGSGAVNSVSRTRLNVAACAITNKLEAG